MTSNAEVRGVPPPTPLTTWQGDFQAKREKRQPVRVWCDGWFADRVAALRVAK